MKRNQNKVVKSGSFLILFKKPVIIGLLVFTILIALVAVLSYQRYMLLKAGRIRELTVAANAAKEKLETAIRNSLSATKTLSHIVARDSSQWNFDQEARMILEDNKFIDAVELVQGGIITHVYPLEGNEAAIGYDILKDSLRNKEALRTITKKGLFFAGPISLKQGYTGIVGRLPIFKDQKFWGFAAVIIKLSTLVDVAEISDRQNQAYSFQLSKVNPNTGLEEFFMPEPGKFNKDDAAVVNLPDGEWKIYARMADGSPLFPVSFLIMNVLFAITGGIFAFYLARRPNELNKLVNEKTILLKRSEEKFRCLVEQNLVGVYILQGKKFRYVNPGFEKITGYHKDQLLNGILFDDLIDEEDRESVNSYLAKVGEKHFSPQYMFKAIRSNGHAVYLEVVTSSIIYEGELATIGTTIDITDRKEEEKRIQSAVLNAQEKERVQIGMELHDNVKQILAASHIYLDFALENIHDSKMVVDLLENVKKYNQEAINELRRLSHQLVPAITGDETLAEKIKKLLDAMNTDRQLKVSLHIDECSVILHNDIQLAIYRILQEQFNNILQHAKASSVSVDIRCNNDKIKLVIKDDGVGFDPSANVEGIGLENIKRRAYVLNGQVKIISSVGNGVELIVQIPVA